MDKELKMAKASTKGKTMSEINIYNDDCVVGMERRLGAESVDHCVTSIPFGAL